MKIYTSRFYNPELKKGIYTTVRISVGKPRWNLGYKIEGEINDLMPFGLFGKYDDDKEMFKQEYFKRLENIGVQKILYQFQEYGKRGKDIVLLCYEDVRKGDNDWCHRIMFAEWWFSKTDEVIKELTDPTTIKVTKAAISPSKAANKAALPVNPLEQISLF